MKKVHLSHHCVIIASFLHTFTWDQGRWFLEINNVRTSLTLCTFYFSTQILVAPNHYAKVGYRFERNIVVIGWMNHIHKKHCPFLFQPPFIYHDHSLCGPVQCLQLVYDIGGQIFYHFFSKLS